MIGVTPVLATRNLNAWFGPLQALKDVSLGVAKNEVLALIGPSGCGKSTFLRCLNRLHEEVTNFRVEGEVLLNGSNIYAADVDPVELRAHIGMVFQKPNPFPSMSIFENVTVGLRFRGVRKRQVLEEAAQTSLVEAALWDEVKDKLKAPGASLSGGQQQRLCIARALAVKPDILLMDEPTSALDPISTAKIEKLMGDLKTHLSIVIVTHNMQQALRISDKTAFFLNGELIESGTTEQIYKRPTSDKTAHYVGGHFG